MIHLRLAKVEDVAGFSVTNVEKGNYFWLLVKGSITSDQPEFHTYIEQFESVLLNKAGVLPNSVYQFLAVIHEDLSSDLYINDFMVEIELMAKRDIQKAEHVALTDIADIRKLRFPEISVAPTDRVIYCFKGNWKFGLFFDLTRELNVDQMELDLGQLFRLLAFQHVYESLESESQFEAMKKDGWFPFIEIAGHEYKILLRCYENKFNFESQIDEIVKSFDQKRIEKITSKWWRKQIFAEKKDTLQAGVNAFLRGDKEGNISCIKTLLSEAEGIMRIQYLRDTGRGKNTRVQELLTYIVEIGRKKSGSNYSLFLPAKFFEYLRDVTFAQFDLEADKVDLSRHSSSHGVAKPESYTGAKALQAILILDQLYFYM